MVEPIQKRMDDLYANETREATEAEMRGEIEPRPTGKEIFDSMSAEEQDEVFGPAVAQALRDGTIALEDVATTAPGGDFLVSRSAEDLGVDTTQSESS